MSSQFVTSLLSHKTAPAVAGSGVSCFTAFDLHTALGYAGQIIGIVSGVASLAWVAYQFIQSRKHK